MTPTAEDLALMNPAELQAYVLKLQAEVDALKSEATSSLRLKISEKGAVSLYGMGRFPTTLYRKQWLTVLAHGETIKQFMTKNAKALDDAESKNLEARQAAKDADAALAEASRKARVEAYEKATGTK
jgi:hypothetical protein